MPTKFKSAVTSYLKATPLSRGTQAEYRTTLRKWTDWGGGASIERLGRKESREFLDWVYEQAVAVQGTNPGRTTNKAREQLRAVLSWAWDQELIEAPGRRVLRTTTRTCLNRPSRFSDIPSADSLTVNTLIVLRWLIARS